MLLFPFTFTNNSCSSLISIFGKRYSKSACIHAVTSVSDYDNKTVIQLKGSVGLCTDNAVLQNVYLWWQT